MEGFKIVAAWIVIMYGATFFVHSFFVPTCRDGFVAALHLPEVGWVCVPGYKPPK